MKKLLCVIAVGVFALTKSSWAAEYYVHPVKGDDAASGAKEAPWKTVKFALSQPSPLKAGDTLFLRGGSYYETSVWTYKKGEAGAPITIRNAPGETPVFYGSDADYETVPSKQWEVHDVARGIYKSVKTWGWEPYGGIYETADKHFGLIAYKTYEPMAADTELYNNEGKYYAGPGYYFNPEDKRLYIRLKHPDPSTHGRDIKLTHSTDPNMVKLWIPTRVTKDYPTSALNFDYVKHVNISGLKFFAYGASAICVWNDCEDMHFKDLTVDSMSPAIRIRRLKVGSVDNLVQNGLTAPYTCWNDCKSSGVSYSVSSCDGIEVMAGCSDIEIKNCRFNGSFDGVRMDSLPKYPTSRIHIHDNIFQDLNDDSISMGTGLADVNIHHNKFLNVSKSVSRVGSSGIQETRGTVYIHHNIIDIKQTYQTRKSADKPPHYISHIPFGTHGIDHGKQSQTWKLYNNTVLVTGPIANDNGVGHELTGIKEVLFDPANPTAYNREMTHEVYNNIFVVKGDFHVGRNATIGSGQEIYDGNIYWRTQPKTPPMPFFSPLYENVENPTNPKAFATLAAFKASPWFALSQKYYPPGWENSGMEVDPRIRPDYTPIAGGPAAQPGIDISKRAWPDADKTNYHGAVAPK